MKTNNDSQRETILLVDDQPNELIALEAVLRCPEYNLLTASSGEEVLQKVNAMNIDLILLDVRMPGMDGFETAAILKTFDKTRDIPIIFITGVDESDIGALKGYHAGAVDYLVKPFDTEILKSKVKAFIELRRQNKKTQSESYERYRVLADAIPHMVWQGKPDGVFDYVNERWCDYTGLSPEKSLGKAWQSIIYPEDLDAFLAMWKKSENEGTSFEVECRVRSGRDGICRWHVMRMVPEIRVGAGTISWLGTGTNIHDRKKVENEMRRASLAAQEANRLKSNFLATMSHEIRTPMNAIVGMTGLLLDTKLSKEQVEYLEGIRGASTSLLSLINDLLDFSKIEAGKLELEVVDFDLGKVVRDCVRNFSPLANKKGVELTLDLPLGVPLYFKGDAGRLQQVLLNLVNNAIKFTTSGSITVRVTAPSSQQFGEVFKVPLYFEVKDTGIGIPSDSIPKIFEAFSQVDSSMTRKFGGTGLGLSICRRIIEAMGGRIGVSSEEGTGSSFWFTVEFERSEMKPIVHEEKTIMLKRGKGRRGRVLVAEDNSANQLLILRLLEKMGFCAEAVANGNEVLDAMRQMPYDLVLMDLQMPEMDGLEATRLIRSDQKLGGGAIPIIAMTANAMRGDREKCLEAGMDDYLAKPLDVITLAEKLEHWMPKKVKQDDAV